MFIISPLEINKIIHRLAKRFNPHGNGWNKKTILFGVELSWDFIGVVKWLWEKNVLNNNENIKMWNVGEMAMWDTLQKRQVENIEKRRILGNIWQIK